MAESDTPRTDATKAELYGLHADSQINDWESFARELELELATANRSCDACLEEIDRLRADNNALRARCDVMPVAWRSRMRSGKGWTEWCLHDRPVAYSLGIDVEPLYAAPQSPSVATLGEGNRAGDAGSANPSYPGPCGAAPSQ